MVDALDLGSSGLACESSSLSSRKILMRLGCYFMQVVLSDLSGLEKKMELTIPAGVVNEMVDKKLISIAGKAKLPGFRPGKVPLSLVRRDYFESVKGEVLTTLVRDTYLGEIKKHQLLTVAAPKITLVSDDDSKLVFDAVFETYPVIELSDLEQLVVEKLEAEVMDTDLESALERMRKQHVTWREVVDTNYLSKAGDRITIDYTIKPLVEGLEVTTGQDVDLVLGDGKIWQEFEQPLYGLSIGAEKSYSLKIPETHLDKKLAGVKAKFTVLVKKIGEAVLPDLDDDFAKKVNIVEGGVAKLKEEIKKQLERALANSVESKFNDSIRNILLSRHTFDLPKSLVEEELMAREKYWNSRYQSINKNTDLPAPPFPREQIELAAKQKVAFNLLVYEIIKQHKIKITPEELSDKVRSLVTSMPSGNQEKSIAEFMNNKDRLLELESWLLQEKAMKFIASQVKTVIKKVDCDEALRRL